MRFHPLHVAIVPLLFLVACKPAPQTTVPAEPQGTTQEDTMMRDDKDAKKYDEATMLKDDAMKSDGAMTQKDDGIMKDDGMQKEATMEKTVYTTYTTGVIGNGKSSVLFFHAPWCPYCRTHDATLTTWYGAKSFPVSTYKVDYDTNAELRAMYGVTSQDTFVLIDGNGKKISSVTGFPSDAQVEALIEQQG